MILNLGAWAVMHYYQFNIGDYKSHTEHLSEMEDLAYRRLLDWYYLHESPIPLDISETSRQIRMRTHCDCIANVLREFFEETPEGWIQHRADLEIEKTGEKSKKASESAKKRWDLSQNVKNNDANAMRTHSEGNATHKTRHITQDTIENKARKLATPEGVSESVWQDFLKLRRAKKAPMTDTALQGIRKEADKAGLTLEYALSECLARGWQGFKAEWVMERHQIATTAPPRQGPDPALAKIIADGLKATPPPSDVREKMKQITGK